MVSEVLPDVPWVQLVFTIPKMLRPLFLWDRTLYGVFPPPPRALAAVGGEWSGVRGFAGPHRSRWMFQPIHTTGARTRRTANATEMQC